MALFLRVDNPTHTHNHTHTRSPPARCPLPGRGSAPRWPRHDRRAADHRAHGRHRDCRRLFPRHHWSVAAVQKIVAVGPLPAALRPLSCADGHRRCLCVAWPPLTVAAASASGARALSFTPLHSPTLSPYLRHLAGKTSVACGVKAVCGPLAHGAAAPAFAPRPSHRPFAPSPCCFSGSRSSPTRRWTARAKGGWVRRTCNLLALCLPSGRLTSRPSSLPLDSVQRHAAAHGDARGPPRPARNRGAEHLRLCPPAPPPVRSHTHVSCCYRTCPARCTDTFLFATHTWFLSPAPTLSTWLR